MSCASVAVGIAARPRHRCGFPCRTPARRFPAHATPQYTRSRPYCFGFCCVHSTAKLASTGAEQGAQVVVGLPGEILYDRDVRRRAPMRLLLTVCLRPLPGLLSSCRANDLCLPCHETCGRVAVAATASWASTLSGLLFFFVQGRKKDYPDRFLVSPFTDNQNSQMLLLTAWSSTPYSILHFECGTVETFSNQRCPRDFCIPIEYYSKLR